jgi:hypothetical protein
MMNHTTKAKHEVKLGIYITERGSGEKMFPHIWD